VWLNIGLSWRITKVLTTPVLVSHPKRGFSFYCVVKLLYFLPFVSCGLTSLPYKPHNPAFNWEDVCMTFLVGNHIRESWNMLIFRAKMPFCHSGKSGPKSIGHLNAIKKTAFMFLIKAFILMNIDAANSRLRIIRISQSGLLGDAAQRRPWSRVLLSLRALTGCSLTPHVKIIKRTGRSRWSEMI